MTLERKTFDEFDETVRFGDSGITRRALLSNACPTICGLNLLGLLHARSALAGQENRSQAPARIKSCIFVFYYGGPSHLDTLDMKPNGPSSVRGEFKPISTSVPGLHICEHMPHLARVMNKVAVIRSMHHENHLHDSASTMVLTGRMAPNGDVENFAPFPQFYPSFGATMSFLRRRRKFDIPHAALPYLIHNVIEVPCQGGGFLGSSYDPFVIATDPKQRTYNSKVLERKDELPPGRIRQRRDLLSQLDFSRQDIAGSDKLDSLYQKAFELLDSKIVRSALDIQQETQKTRDRYGWSDGPFGNAQNGAELGFARNMRGQNLLLARRLVEAGVPFVNVYDFKQQGQNWDAHADNFKQHKDYLLPPADRALATLIEDLDERGLLDSTLVVATGEFGRTPKINANAGRDHWPDCYSVMLAGGGIKGGYVHGASDNLGNRPKQDPVTPGDLAATIFHALGIDPATLIHDKTNRPHHIATGKPILNLFA